MKTPALVSATAVLATALASLGVAPAAHAADCTTVEPSSTAYQLRISPTYVVVNGGATVTLATRLVRDGRECGPGARVGFWTRGKGQTTFRLSRTGTTDSRGLATARFTVGNDFRWYTNHVVGGREAARSIAGLVQVR